MPRYYSKTDKNEWLPPVDWDEILPVDVVVLADEHFFWSPLPATGDYMTFDGAGLPVLNTYLGSINELTDAIATKQQEVREHYETLHGEPLASVVKRQAAASPSVVTTANAITNIAIADGGIAAIAALIDKATVDAYSVVGLSWS